MSSSPRTVLVTGGNGYLGSAVVLHFLEHGYKVHTTVRSLAKANGLKRHLLPRYSSSLSFFVVEDMTQPGAYEQSKALEGVDAVLHVASPIPDLTSPLPSGADWTRDIIRPAIDGTRTVITAASQYPRIRHVIITSSTAALQTFAAASDPATKDAALDETAWGSTDPDDPALKDKAFPAYFTSKACAEKAAWDYVKEHKPHWTLATFCPPFFFGPAGIAPRTRAEFGSSLALFYRMMKSDDESNFSVNGGFVDVRDIAQAFRLALEKPLETSERFVLGTGSQTTEEVVAFAKSLDPAVLQERPTRYNTSKVMEMLGWKPRTKRETFVDMANYLQEAEKGFGSQTGEVS